LIIELVRLLSFERRVFRSLLQILSRGAICHLLARFSLSGTTFHGYLLSLTLVDGRRRLTEGENWQLDLKLLGLLFKNIECNDIINQRPFLRIFLETFGDNISESSINRQWNSGELFLYNFLLKGLRIISLEGFL